MQFSGTLTALNNESTASRFLTCYSPPSTPPSSPRFAPFLSRPSQNMILQGLIPQPLFSFWLNRNQDVSNGQDTTKGGELVFGGVDPEHFAGNHVFAPVKRRGYWQFALDRVGVDDNTSQGERGADGMNGCLWGRLHRGVQQMGAWRRLQDDRHLAFEFLTSTMLRGAGRPAWMLPLPTLVCICVCRCDVQLTLLA